MSSSPSITPSVSNAPSEFCLDVPDWTDSYGDGCDWYNDWYNNLNNGNGSYVRKLKKGGNFKDHNDYYDDACDHYADVTGTYGLSAPDACCICGGGTGEEGFALPSANPSISAAPSAIPSVSNAPSMSSSPSMTETCLDVPDLSLIHI